MLEGVSPVLGANGPHAVYSVSRFGLVVSRASKNHHASYQDQTIEEKGILGAPLSWRGLKRYHPNFRGPFWVQNQWQSTFFAGKPCSCVSWSFNSSCLPQRRNGKFHSSENVSVVPSLCEWMDDQVLHIIVCQLLDVHNIPVGMQWLVISCRNEYCPRYSMIYPPWN